MLRLLEPILVCVGIKCKKLVINTFALCVTLTHDIYIGTTTIILVSATTRSSATARSNIAQSYAVIVMVICHRLLHIAHSS